RVEKARASGDQPLALDEILAPESMAKIREEVHAAIRGQGAIMILGESGTGKTHLARAIARATKAEPVVRATLGLSDDLNTITSELFGHERGAFSGAVSKRKGLVEHAHGGTLILDEVLNLRPQAQQLLLDFTQFGTYRPLGYQGEQPKKASLRLISVTNGDIAQAVQDTRFRQDLYFRLATVPLVLPPLRERRWDIPDIALRYLRRTDPGRPWRLSEEAHHRLTNPDLRWSGNIRELEAVIERARNRCLVNEDVDPVLDPGHLDLGDGQQGLSILPRPAPNPSAPAREGGGVRERWDDLLERRASLESTEKEIIAETLEMCEGVVARAARQLSVSRTGLISRIASLGIVVPKKRSGGQR
ncbi:MAG: sigma 54-interacting transcriptional regulator, partial [Myxococcota bacterium]